MILAAAVWVAMFSLLLMRVTFLNDHFDRISRGRQIFAYGATPFADFRDPGYFLTLYVSAAAQWWTGGGLLGDAVVSSAAIATAAACAFLLAGSASGSLIVGLLAPLLMVLVPPRYYDYDKVLFYTAGVAACWWYIESPSFLRIAVAGVITTLAALFRYDNGLYVFVACVATIVVRRIKGRVDLVSDLVWYLLALGVAALPALIVIHVTAGLQEAARQIVAYAVTEGRRSELFDLPPLAFDRDSITYVLVVAAAPIALLHVVLQSRRTEPSAESRDAKVIAAALLLACVCLFVLRDPIGARLGAVVPVAIVLAASVAGYWRVPVVGARAGGSRSVGRNALVAGVAVIVLGLVLRQEVWRVVRAPWSVARRLIAMRIELRESPPPRRYFPNGAALAGLAEYLRACTPTDSRVLLTWFAPEVFFFAERGFAGGMTVFLGTHWSSEQDQRRTLQQLESENVPLVIMQTESEQSFHAIFPLLAAHLDTKYRDAGTTSFGDPRAGSDGYRVLIARDVGAVGTNPQWQLPCVSGHTAR